MHPDAAALVAAAVGAALDHKAPRRTVAAVAAAAIQTCLQVSDHARTATGSMETGDAVEPGGGRRRRRGTRGGRRRRRADRLSGNAQGNASDQKENVAADAKKGAAASLAGESEIDISDIDSPSMASKQTRSLDKDNAAAVSPPRKSACLRTSKKDEPMLLTPENVKAHNLQDRPPVPPFNPRGRDTQSEVSVRSGRTRDSASCAE